jgi:cell fate (sporulation/competence/biofilm development) regulator YlbF (YheA/YmcA/DUF963 family)
MADDQNLLAEARKLGALIASQQVVQSYRDLARQVDLDISARSLLEQFEQAMEALAVKEASGQPIEIAEKRNIQSLQQSVTIHPLLKKLVDSQMEYMGLMRKVQEAINSGVNGEAAPRAESGSAPRLIVPG